MDVVVTSAAMQACDRRATLRTGVPSGILMENAGREVALVVAGALRSAGGSCAVFVCGSGSNGGDGFVAARHLLGLGFAARVVLVGTPSRLRGDALSNFSVLRRLARSPASPPGLRIARFSPSHGIGPADTRTAVVDALLGTGVRGALRPAYRRAVRTMNKSAGVKIAIDVPTGLDPDTGRIAGECFRADVTVTMGFLKTGLLTGMGPAVCGRLIVAGLGVPLTTGRKSGADTFRVGAADAFGALPDRPFNAHKHSTGKVLVVAGSVGYTGAAALCATAAMRSGAGSVVLAVPEGVYPVLARKLSEVIVRPVRGSASGALGPGAFDDLVRDLEWADVVVAGPGLGRGDGVSAFLEKLLKLTGKRFVLDADVLYHLAGNRRLAGILRRNTCILTPHTGEFSRFSGLNARAIEMDRVALARAWSKRIRSILVLKGAPTVTALPGGAVYINSTGNPGMASAGMGDVLAGLLGGLWAGSGNAADAAWSAVCLHGLAGDWAAERVGERAMMAGDLLNEISNLFKKSEVMEIH